MRSVAQAVVSIPGSVQRLKKQGYAQNILMQDIWPLVVPATAGEIQQQVNNIGNDDTIPIVFSTLIIDEIGGTGGALAV